MIDLQSLLLKHLPVLPVLLPAFTGMVLLLLGDAPGGHAHPKLKWGRRISRLSAVLGLALGLLMVGQAAGGDLQVYRVGDWPAPFGIVLVIDRLSAMMVLLTSLVAVPVLWYACGGWDSHGRHFHAIFHFQLMGLAGAFVTGDIFNLFVFFEVLLIASYVLMVHGQGRTRFQVGVQYVVLNLLASALFLVGVSLLYAVTGTLNFADLALRVAQISGMEAVLARSAALILLVVFGFKAALLPLSLWLPGTYAAASAPVAALFAIMTKVGVYAILRVHGVVFGDAAGEAALVAEPWLLPLAMGTCLLGALGALSSRTLPRLVAWLTVASVGTTLLAIGLFTPEAWSAAFYYLAHSTLVVAGLFLLVELVSAQRGDVGDQLAPSSPVAQPVLLGTMLLLAAASVAGLPPLPGFLGKVMLLQAAWVSEWQAWVWGVVLLVGFMSIVALARAGSVLFWNVRPDLPASPAGASPRLIMPTLTLVMAGVIMSIGAAPLKRYTDAMAHQLLDRQAYARAVLGVDERTGQPLVSVRPYRMPSPDEPIQKEAP